jgi:exonuclease VII small subunit
MSELNNIGNTPGATASDKKSVQDKLTDLSELVGWFQGTSFKLETALDKFKQAEALAEEIEKDLTKLKNDIKVVKKRFDTEE